MPKRPQTEDRPAVFEAGIVCPDGRSPVLLTPRAGLPGAEAEAIARTYRDTAHAEGGRVEIHNLSGYPVPALVDLQLGLAEASLKRRTGCSFTLNFFGGVLRAVRDDGFHAAAAIPPTPPQTFRRNEGDLIGPDAVTPPEERDRLSFQFRVEDAIAAIARGHLQGEA